MAEPGTYDNYHIRNWRMKLRLTQKEAALFLGVSVSTYRRWERGEWYIPAPAERLMLMIVRYGTTALSEHGYGPWPAVYNCKFDLMLDS